VAWVFGGVSLTVAIASVYGLDRTMLMAGGGGLKSLYYALVNFGMMAAHWPLVVIGVLFVQLLQRRYASRFAAAEQGLLYTILRFIAVLEGVILSVVLVGGGGFILFFYILIWPVQFATAIVLIRLLALGVGKWSLVLWPGALVIAWFTTGYLGAWIEKISSLKLLLRM